MDVISPFEWHSSRSSSFYNHNKSEEVTILTKDYWKNMFIVNEDICLAEVKTQTKNGL